MFAAPILLTIAHAADLGLTLVICAETGAQQLDREVHSKIDITRLISRGNFLSDTYFTSVYLTGMWLQHNWPTDYIYWSR